MLRNRLLEEMVLPLGDLLLGSAFVRSLKEIRSFDMLSAEALEKLQAERLRETLLYATRHAQLYRAMASEIPHDPVDWLKSFPILTKQTLREETGRLLTRLPRGLIRKSSSGSSGIQSSVFVTSRELSIQRAMFAHWWNWSGYRIGEPMIQTGMQPQRGFVKAGKDLLFGIRYLSAYAYRPKEVRSLLYSLQGKRPIHLGGYASSLFAIAQLAEQEGITDVQFKGVVAWGDKLFAHYRSTIERVFSTRVFETYGCSEGLMIAAQKDNEFLYTMTPTVYLELLDDRGNDVPDGELGHVVVTSLTARAMPLIRYRLGDMAIRLPRSAYPDTRELAYPLLQQVIGRDTDLVRIRGGSIMVVHAFTRIFEDIPEIRQFHVVQRNLDSLEIEYIPGRGFHPAVLDAVAKKIQEGIEEPLSVTFRQVDEILDSPSGKPQIIQSLLDRGDIGP